MQTEPRQPLIYSRIAAAMSEIGAVGKAHRNKEQGYSFRSIDDFYDTVQPVLSKHKIFIAPTILEHAREQKTTRSGSVLMTTLTKVRFKIFTEDGSYIEADQLGEGADSGDKSANKAAATALKYLLMQVFCIRVNGEQHDSEVDHHEYSSRTLPSTPPAAKAPPASVPTPSRGELLQTLLVKLCPTDEVRHALTTYLRAVPSKSGKFALLGEEGLEKLDDAMLRYIVSHWPEIWPKVDAWHSNQVPGAEMPSADIPEPGYPFSPKDKTKANYKGMTLKQLFEADRNFAYGIAMNFSAEPWTDKSGKQHEPSPAVVAFAKVCEEWRAKQDSPQDDFVAASE